VVQCVRRRLPHQTPLSAISCGEGVDFENVVGVGAVQHPEICYRRRRRRRAERRVGAYEGAMMSGSADGGYPGIGVTTGRRQRGGGRGQRWQSATCQRSMAWWAGDLPAISWGKKSRDDRRMALATDFGLLRIPTESKDCNFAMGHTGPDSKAAQYVSYNVDIVSCHVTLRNGKNVLVVYYRLSVTWILPRVAP
jgi:hypothetical protein